MIQCRFGLPVALAMSALSGCAAFDLEKTVEAGVSAAASVDVCRERISAPYSSSGSALGSMRKMGPIEPLPNAQLYNLLGTQLLNSDIRLYRSRVMVANFLGMTFDRYAVCFFEKHGNTYHFVQVCHTEDLSMTLKGCHVNWIHIHAAQRREQSAKP